MITITKKEIEEYKRLKKQYQSIVNTSILEHCNKIIQIGAYTAELNEDNNVILSRTKFPSQFSEKSATQIVRMDWRTTNDKKANVEIYNVKEWYKDKIQSLDFIINNLGHN
jgi:hypothetical protein